MINRRLEIGQRLRCGEVFLTNVDGYSSSCAVECQLCDNRTICSLDEFSEHIETCHTDREDELHHEKLEEIAEELTNSNDEVIEPFEKVLIITESKATLGLVYADCEETIGRANEYFENYTEKSESSTKNTGRTVNLDEILKEKTNNKIKSYSQPLNDDDESESYSSNESLCGQNKYDELPKEIKVKNNHNENAPIDRSEDSGVEKSEASSITASTPQHLTSEDEAPFEPDASNIKEQIRLAMDEPPPKPKLTSEHMEKLIELYETQPRLWQQTHPEYNRPILCRKSWKIIARTWNKIYNKNFSYRDVRIRIATLCQRYLKERKRQEMICEFDESKKGTITSRFKHYDRLRFLDACKETPYKEHYSRLSQEHEKLLEVYRHFPILWTNQDKHHECVELREKAYADMCTALQLQGIHIPPKMIRQRLTCLRSRYRLEKMRRLHSKLQGKPFQTVFKQYESMKFLDNFLAPFVCEKCGKVFRTLADYEHHLAQKQYVKDDQISNKSFESNSNNENSNSKLPEEVDLSHINVVSLEEVGPSENQTQNNNNEINLNENLNQNLVFHPIEGTIQFELPAMNALMESSNTDLMGISNACTIFEHNFQEGSSTDVQDPLSVLSNFIEGPIVLKTLDSNEDLRNYFSNEQFLAITSAFENVGDDLGNPSTVQQLNIHGNNIPPFNTVFKSPLNNLQMQTDNQITLQLLENSVELPSNSPTYVPIELILENGTMVTGEGSQNSSNIDIVPQYTIHDKNQLMELTNFNGTINDAAISKPIENNYYQTDHETNPMAIRFEETCTLFDNQNQSTFFNQNELVSGQTLLKENELTEEFPRNEITPSSMPDSSTSEFLKGDSNCIISETDNVDCTIEDVAEEIVGMTSENIDEEKTDEDKKLTAKIECGSLQFELNLETEMPSCSLEDQQSLNGRLPREHAIALITSYRNFPELWHPEHINFSCRRLRRIAWRTLAKELNKELNTNFSWMKIQRKILDYVKYFRHERRRIQNKRGCTQWTLYEHFDFLDKVMTPPSDLEKLKQQRALTLKIIDIYKTHPELWNTEDPNYTTRHLRPQAISEMCNRLQEIHNITIEDAKLKQRIQELRKEYRTTKIARVLAERRLEKFEPLAHFEFYEDLYFLEEHIPPFNCVNCNMEFKCFTDYRVHIKQEHKAKQRLKLPMSEFNIDKISKENICHVCGTKFTMRRNLLQHLHRHYIGRSLACSHCDKKFFTKYSLQDHERTHTKEPAVICTDCGLPFVNISKLNQHMKRHRNQRDHKCQECGKLFFTAYDRDRHWRQHFKIRDKVCPVCSKTFVEGSSYYAHMKLHKEKKDYACPVCAKEFAQYAGLYKHFKRYHPLSDKKIGKRHRVL